MTSTVDPATADRQLKARHRAMWAAGDYPAVARELIPALGPELVAACGIAARSAGSRRRRGHRQRGRPGRPDGCDPSIASDLTPELFEVGRRQAAAAGVELEWRRPTPRRCPSPPTGSTS